MCLNSHPISPLSTFHAPLSNDPEDFAYLTPGPNLIKAPLTSIPEPSVEFIAENRLNVGNWYGKFMKFTGEDVY